MAIQRIPNADTEEITLTPIDVAKIYFILFSVSFVAGIAMNNGAK